jgi:hypothetical protein
MLARPTVTHRFRANATGNREIDYQSISLPHIPGVVLCSDRQETAPTAPAIRMVKRKPTGCTIFKPSRYAIIRAALVDIAEDCA